MSYPTYLMHYSDELCHHGIKGQKWGERRYQYEDGSLTPEGKKRYLNSDGTLNKKGEKVLKKIYSKGNYESLHWYNKSIKDAKDSIPKYERDLKDIEKNGIKSKYFKRYLDEWVEDGFEIDNPDKEDLKEVKRLLRNAISSHKDVIKDNNEKIKNIKTELKEYGLDNVKISDIDDERITKSIRNERGTKAFFTTLGISSLLANPIGGLVFGMQMASMFSAPLGNSYSYYFDDYDKKDKK